MIYRIFPSKDTFITNDHIDRAPVTSSNFGQNEILHVYKAMGVSGAAGVYSSSSLARILMKFDMSELTSMQANGEIPATGLTYRLKMFDAQHDDTLPSSFDLEMVTLSLDWDEGRGHDVDHFSDKGFANWDKAKTNSFWSTPGASGSGVIMSTHFDTGHEDINADITQIVQQWISGSVTNNGLRISISSSQEVDNNDYYIKKFHSKETFFKDKRPSIDITYDDSIRDDRSSFFFDIENKLYLYNVVRGQRTNISQIGTGSIYVRISDKSGSLMIVTGSHAGSVGVYSASITIATGSYSGSLFTDVWFSGSSTFMTGTFGVANNFSITSQSPKMYDVSVKNLKNQYEVDELVRFNLFVKPHDYNPARVMTASLNFTGDIINKAYYRIVNDRTDEVSIPFGTGSVETTRLSYDGNGNYFKMYMSSLAPGNVYRVSFLFDVDGQRQLIDDGFRFRVKSMNPPSTVSAQIVSG